MLSLSPGGLSGEGDFLCNQIFHNDKKLLNLLFRKQQFESQKCTPIGTVDSSDALFANRTFPAGKSGHDV